MLLHMEIMVIALLTAVTCSLPGVFLVLRGVALMSDALSHAILLGIALMFLWVQSLNSPLLLLGAACAGVLTVLCTELIIHSKKLKQDAAIGLVFPLFFSIGVILISLYARSVHLDVDMVLLGEIAFAPFTRCIIAGIDCGPYALWVIGCVLVINLLFIRFFFKELLITTFDKKYAMVIGISPLFFYYCLMIIISVTAVATFDIVGSIMVVALMITPAATAYLLTKRVGHMLTLSACVAALSAIVGYILAWWCDVSIAGAIATMTGVCFVGALGLHRAKNKWCN